jgi:hypothetical protein
MNKCLEFVEREFVLHRDGKAILVGHPDCVRVYQRPSVVCVLERKFGYKEVTSADANLQLRAYLVLVASEFPADAYYACLTQPRISSKPRIVHYTPAGIVKARAEIETIYDACFAPDAPRHPSPEACAFCAARLSQSCPEHIAWVNAVQTVGRLPVSAWTDEQMEIFELRRSAAIKFIDDVHEQIKKIKEATPERLPGWVLRPGAEVRTCEDLVAAWVALQSHLTAREFSDACEMSLGAIEETIWRKHQDNPSLGKLTQKQAKRLVNDALAAVLVKRRNKPSLVKDE